MKLIIKCYENFLMISLQIYLFTKFSAGALNKTENIDFLFKFIMNYLRQIKNKQ